MIYNHITVRVPGPERHYLLNPFGLTYDEVTATNLIKVDLAGRPVTPTPHPVNVAGFVIHSAIHAARDDAHCVMHTHTTAGMAVACKADGLRADNFYSAILAGQIAYHRFEGVTTDLDEQPRLIASLGDKNVLILRNHGLLVVAPTIPWAVSQMWTLQRACEVQLAADSMGGANQPIDPAVLARIPDQVKPIQSVSSRPGQLMFDAILRRAGIRYEDLV